MQLGPLVHSDDAVSATFSLDTPKGLFSKQRKSPGSTGPLHFFSTCALSHMEVYGHGKKGADSMVCPREDPLRDSVNLWALRLYGL